MAVYWLAFYKARGTIVDRAIRWVTRSPYSHVEIILSPSRPAIGDTARMAFSSSSRDGGVRSKCINFDLANWDFLPISWVNDDRLQMAINSYTGLRYDYLGLAMSQFLNLRRGASARWFCSEIVAWILDMPVPSALSPGDLSAWVAHLNNLHQTSAQPQTIHPIDRQLGSAP